MDKALNPFAPGAGTPPPLLAGRDDVVGDAEVALTRAKAGLPARSQIVVGLRGVGKTVVLNKIQDLAESKGYQTAYIEAVEDEPLIKALVPQLRRILLKLDRIEATHEVVRKSIRTLRSFASAFKIQLGDIEIGVEPETGSADSGDLATDLPELLLSVGEAAYARKTAVVLIIDEIQYYSEADLRSLISAIHRCNQRKLPILLVGAGLPQILGKMGDEKTYAERLFQFPRVAALSSENAKDALSKPALAQKVEFSPEALDEIVKVTEGYPYFLQEWGYVTWNVAGSNLITMDDVIKAKDEAIRRLDESFFRVRLDRMTPTEKKYMRAMAGLGAGPHSSGDIAKAYGAKVTTVAPIRSSLISKGMIFAPGHALTAFTVPMFHEFMCREIPATIAAVD